MNEPRREIEEGTVIDLSREVLGLRAEAGTVCLMERVAGPPKRLAGHTIGAPMLSGDSPHAGERHPDGDEVLFVVSGAIDVHLELETGDRTVRVGQGEALVVPKGVWHLVEMVEPGQMVHITPGPGGEARPLGGAD